MTMIDEMIEEATDGKTDLGTLLRRCKVLALELDSQQLEEWVGFEVNGYPEEVSVPKYRILPMNLKGNFVNHSMMAKSLDIPSGLLPDDWRESYENFMARQSITSIQETIERGKTGRIHVGAGNLVLLINQKNIYPGSNCLQAWCEISIFSLTEIVTTVRNKILDLLLALKKENPELATIPVSELKFSSASIEKIVINNINTGDNSQVVGLAENSNISQNIKVNDFNTLKLAFEDEGVSECDIVELREAIDSDPQKLIEGKFGPKVAKWIGSMTSKAADGSWAIGVGAAGAILAEFLKAYYGI